MKNFDVKKLNNDIINIRISSKGYGRCYYEVRKDIRKELLDIRKDIIHYGLGLDIDKKCIVNDLLTIIENYYFK